MFENLVDIPGFEGRLKINKLGEVAKYFKLQNTWIILDIPAHCSVSSSRRKSGTSPKFYRRLSIDCKKYTVGHLVLLTFIGPRPSELYEVRHLNDNSLDDRLENLTWGTRIENMLDCKVNGRMRRALGERSSKSKLTVESVRLIRQNKTKLSDKELAAILKVDPSTVCDVRNHRTWKHIH